MNAVAEKPDILDYAAAQRLAKSRAQAVAGDQASPTIPTAYPVDEPAPPLPLLLMSFFVIPLLVTIGLLGFLYFAILRQGHSSSW